MKKDDNELTITMIDDRPVVEIWEETENEIRYRQRNPDSFIEDSFRRIKLEGIDGVAMIIGKLKPVNVPEWSQPESMVTQAYRFAKKTPENKLGWTIEEVRTWLKRNWDIGLRDETPASSEDVGKEPESVQDFSDKSKNVDDNVSDKVDFSFLTDKEYLAENKEIYSASLPIEKNDSGEEPLVIPNVFVFTIGKHKKDGPTYVSKDMSDIKNNYETYISGGNKLPIQVSHSLNAWDTVGYISKVNLSESGDDLAMDLTITEPEAKAKYNRGEFHGLSIGIVNKPDKTKMAGEVSFTPFPAVYGAGRIMFSRDEENKVEEKNTKEMAMSKDNKENVETPVVPTPDVDKNSAATPPVDKQVNTPDNTELLSKIETLQNEINEHNSKEKKSRVEAFVTKSLEKGVIAPAQKDNFSAFVEKLSDSAEQYSTEMDMLDAFESILDQMSKAVPLGSDIQVPSTNMDKKEDDKDDNSEFSDGRKEEKMRLEKAMKKASKTFDVEIEEKKKGE